jgi:hypothetical protein
MAGANYETSWPAIPPQDAPNVYDITHDSDLSLVSVILWPELGG